MKLKSLEIEGNYFKILCKLSLIISWLGIDKEEFIFERI